MNKQITLVISRIAGFVLVLGSSACIIGVTMYSINRFGPNRGFLFHAWERGFIVTAVILSAIGFLVLADAFADPNERALAKIGAAGYFFAAILLVAGETLAFTIGWEKVSALIGVYVFMAFLSTAFIGAALVKSQMIFAWIGWITIIWNLGWPLAFLIAGMVNASYFPILHHIVPFVIGIALLRKTT